MMNHKSNREKDFLAASACRTLRGRRWGQDAVIAAIFQEE